MEHLDLYQKSFLLYPTMVDKTQKRVESNIVLCQIAANQKYVLFVENRFLLPELSLKVNHLEAMIDVH